MNTKSAATEPRFGKNIVAAWFETVINPILRALSVEKDYLTKKYWTWQAVPGRLESIRRVDDMVPAGYQPNLRQFEKYHPKIKESLGFHDDAAVVLFVACKNMARVILDSGALKPILDEVTTDAALAELGKSQSDLFFGGDIDDQLKQGWIAQEIINGTKSLPSYIGHSPLWNKHRDKFMEVLNHPEVSKAHNQVEHAGEDLLKKADRLGELLTETREQLSIQNDVPPVPIPSASMLAA